MIPPAIPRNEKQRQAAVEKYELLDTLPEPDYDNVTSLMSFICNVPISLITLLDHDRNFLKSHHGIPFAESPREISFCGHAINSEDPVTLIEDARKDERFFDNPLVTDFNAVFYAGVPLINPDGYKLGTLCVYDTKPRHLTTDQLNALQAMSRQVVNLLELRHQNLQLIKYQNILERRNQNLEKLTSVVSHDIKSPLSNIILLANLLENHSKGQLDDESMEYLKHLKSSSISLKQYIDGILEFYRSDSLIQHQHEEINFDDFMNELKQITTYEADIELTYQYSSSTIELNKAALMQILINLISNSIKYNSKSVRLINIKISEDDDNYIFAIKDNGDGISPEALNHIFDLFFIAKNSDRNGLAGTGIGLATVKNIITNLNGEINVESETGIGTTFIFTLPKSEEEIIAD